MKKTIVFFMVILLMIGASGCMRSNFGAKTDITEQMVSYINDKYSEDVFEYKGQFGGGAGADTKTIIVSSKNYPDADIYVRHNLKNENIYSDNYLSIKYAAQTELAVKEALNKVIFDQYVMFYEGDRYACPNQTGTMTFEEYISNAGSCIGFNVVVNGITADKENFEKSLEKAISEAEICCSATIYFDNDSGAFDSLASEGLSGYTFKKLYSDVFSFEMSNCKEFSTSHWGE